MRPCSVARGVGLPQDGTREAGIPSRRRACLGAFGADATGYSHAGAPPPSRPTLEPSRSEACGGMCLIESLGISLPCQVVLVDLRIACTLMHRS
jgi:hypothetical protein